MLKIAVQTGGMESSGSSEEDIIRAYATIKAAGFDAVDANLDHLISYSTITEKKVDPMWLTEGDEIDLTLFDPWRKGAMMYGLKNYQAHAPFPSYIYEENGEGYNKSLINMLKKIIRGCAYIGCGTLIIHPFFLPYEYQLTPEKEWEVNIASYAALIDTAKKYHVTICLENMFVAFKGKRYEACCTDIDTACKYIDTLNEMAGEKVFGFCLDTGHLVLLGRDVKEAMVKLGDRICAFHVHDNDGNKDQHLAPYFGVLDWNRFIEGLKEIHYSKTISFETYNIWNQVDKEMAPEIIQYICHCGRMFAQRAGL